METKSHLCEALTVTNANCLCKVGRQIHQLRIHFVINVLSAKDVDAGCARIVSSLVEAWLDKHEGFDHSANRVERLKDNGYVKQCLNRLAIFFVLVNSHIVTCTETKI